MINNLVIDLEEQYWFDGDKFLSYIIRRELDDFRKKFNLLDDSTLSLLPECRHYARKKFLHKESLSEIVKWCTETGTGSSEKFNYDCVGYFFWEDSELVFAKMFIERFKEFVNERSADEVEEILIYELTKLDGASFKRLAMQKWGN